MTDDRISQPIVGLGPSRDRPFELNRFDRIEAARGGGDGPPRRRKRQAPAPVASPAAPTSPADSDATDRPLVGTRLNVVG